MMYRVRLCVAQDRSTEPFDWSVGGPGVVMMMMMMMMMMMIVQVKSLYMEMVSEVVSETGQSGPCSLRRRWTRSGTTK